jgi:hypothetical protein
MLSSLNPVRRNIYSAYPPENLTGGGQRIIRPFLNIQPVIITAIKSALNEISSGQILWNHIRVNDIPTVFEMFLGKDEHNNWGFRLELTSPRLQSLSEFSSGFEALILPEGGDILTAGNSIIVRTALDQSVILSPTLRQRDFDADFKKAVAVFNQLVSFARENNRQLLIQDINVYEPVFSVVDLPEFLIPLILTAGRYGTTLQNELVNRTQRVLLIGESTEEQLIRAAGQRIPQGDSLARPNIPARIRTFDVLSIDSGKTEEGSIKISDNKAFIKLGSKNYLINFSKARVLELLGEDMQDISRDKEALETLRDALFRLRSFQLLSEKDNKKVISQLAVLINATETIPN